jgi:hypothetical protein
MGFTALDGLMMGTGGQLNGVNNANVAGAFYIEWKAS